MAAESFDLRLVAPFVAVADAPTYAAAAATLGLTPTALSERIGRLERQLGARLFDREGRRVALTAAGRRLLVEARTILDRAGQVSAALRAEPGTVRICLNPAAASDELRTVIGRFAAERPGLQLEINECSSREATEALRRGDVDVTVDYPLGSSPGMCYSTWKRRPFELVCGPEHRLADRTEAAWSDLDDEPVFVASPGVLDGYVAMLRAAFTRAQVRLREAPAYRVSTAQYMVPRVERGDAVMILPDWAFPTLPPGLVHMPLTPTQEIEVGLSWNGATTSPAVRGFVALLRSHAPTTTASVVDRSGPEPALADRDS